MMIIDSVAMTFCIHLWCLPSCLCSRTSGIVLSVDNGVILLDSTRIVVPRAAVKTILQRMHAGHPGINKSMVTTRKLFYWPGMTNDVKTFVGQCMECVKLLPSQHSNPCVASKSSAAIGPPMAHVTVDLFDFAWKKYLLCVARWSSFPLYKRLPT